jgi:predicted DNA-binding protein
MNQPALKPKRRPSPKFQQFSVTMSHANRRQIDKLAKASGRSRSGYVAHVLDQHLDEVSRAA